MSAISLPVGIKLDDPRPIAASAPYTFFMPHPDELAALGPGDRAQAIFRQLEGAHTYEAERMWVLIESLVDGFACGTLDSEPAGMDMFHLGDPVVIPLTHAISTVFSKDNPRPKTPTIREYWDRCFVDACVVKGRCQADYLYREEPDMTREGDKYEDSGWRIRGTSEAIADDEKRDEGPLYIALGKVLNADDRWLHLIDRDFGVAFQWNPETQNYIELE